MPSRPAAPRPAPLRPNLADRAYDRLEALIVCCALAPGQVLSIQDLQIHTGTGRTPTHQAVSRLAADTLVLIRPRHGLQIAPLDLERERTLLRLRRPLERFVVRRAAERIGPGGRAALTQIATALRSSGVGLDGFNRLDRQIDQLLSAAAGEPFLEQTLRPLHTMARRIGWLYHTKARPLEGLDRTIACHLAVLDAVTSGQPQEAAAASDRLVAFSDSMFNRLKAARLKLAA